MKPAYYIVLIGGAGVAYYLYKQLCENSAIETESGNYPTIGGDYIETVSNSVSEGIAQVKNTVSNILSLSGISANRNNLGNIRATVFNGTTGTSGGFAVFDSVESGLRAMVINMRTSANKYGRTLAEYISAYAPPSENKTGQYLAYVSAQSGVDGNTKLSDLTQDQKAAIISAQIKIEGATKQTVSSGAVLPFVNTYWGN